MRQRMRLFARAATICGWRPVTQYLVLPKIGLPVPCAAEWLVPRTVRCRILGPHGTVHIVLVWVAHRFHSHKCVCCAQPNRFLQTDCRTILQWLWNHSSLSSNVNLHTQYSYMKCFFSLWSSMSFFFFCFGESIPHTTIQQELIRLKGIYYSARS